MLISRFYRKRRDITELLEFLFRKFTENCEFMHRHKSKKDLSLYTDKKECSWLLHFIVLHSYSGSNSGKVLKIKSDHWIFRSVWLGEPPPPAFLHNLCFVDFFVSIMILNKFVGLVAGVFPEYVYNTGTSVNYFILSHSNRFEKKPNQLIKIGLDCNTGPWAPNWLHDKAYWWMDAYWIAGRRLVVIFVQAVLTHARAGCGSLFLQFFKITMTKQA